jgi:hypothetical protein
MSCRELGCGAFVTGPLMRLGAASADSSVQVRVGTRSNSCVSGVLARIHDGAFNISMGHTETERCLESPQAMLLVVPNGKSSPERTAICTGRSAARLLSRLGTPIAKPEIK